MAVEMSALDGDYGAGLAASNSWNHQGSVKSK